jgi:hypothetical protein
MAVSEKEREVIAWRKQVLIDAGWEPAMALEIAVKGSVDLRIAEAAIKCGDSEQALYLLSLTDKPGNR